MGEWEVITGDCLEVMRGMDAGSVDAIITDLPYGTTACSWDSVIPFEPMWAAIRYVLKTRGVFVTTASQPFTSALVMSNVEWFKNEWIWEKDQISNPQLAQFSPLLNYEAVVVFSEKPATYNPQNLKRVCIRRKSDSAGKNLKHLAQSKNYTQEFTNYPKRILRFPTERGLHPTQKSVPLYKYLVSTYTNEGETVLDMTAGSGTTGVACIQTGRRFIGIEIDPTYADIARARCAKAAEQARQMELVLA